MELYSIKYIKFMELFSKKIIDKCLKKYEPSG